jgi:hypothetical protein
MNLKLMRAIKTIETTNHFLVFTGNRNKGMKNKRIISFIVLWPKPQPNDRLHQEA